MLVWCIFGRQPWNKVLFMNLTTIKLFSNWIHDYTSKSYTSSRHSTTGQATLIVYSLCCHITIKWITNALYYISFIVNETHFLITLFFCFCFTLTHLFHSFLFKVSKPFPWPPKENWTDLPQNLKKVKHQDHQYRILQTLPFPPL